MGSSHRVGRFVAVGDDGGRYKVVVYAPADDGAAGLRLLRTAGGDRVDRAGRGEYRVARTGVTLRSDSPAAL